MAELLVINTHFTLNSLETSEAAVPVAHNALFVLCLAYLRAQCALKEVHPLPDVFLGSQKCVRSVFGAVVSKSEACVMKGAGDGGGGGGGMQEIVLGFKGCRSRLKAEF